MKKHGKTEPFAFPINKESLFAVNFKMLEVRVELNSEKTELFDPFKLTFNVKVIGVDGAKSDKTGIFPAGIGNKIVDSVYF